MSSSKLTAADSIDVREILESTLEVEVLKEGPDGRELNVFCPFCCDDKPNHMYVNAESGLWSCHKCGEKGSLSGLARRLLELGRISSEACASALSQVARRATEDRKARVRGVLSTSASASHARALTEKSASTDLPMLAKVAEVLHDELTEEHRREVRAWLSDASIDRFCLGSVTTNLPSRLRALGVDLERCVELGILKSSADGYAASHIGAITVPTLVEGGVSNIEQRMPAGREPRKLSLKGRPRELFNSSAATAGERVFLTEGASDAMVLADLGFAAVGAPSATIFRREWVARFSTCSDVALVFDNDDAGRKGARRVQELLIKAKIPVRDVVLPSEHDGSPTKDVRDFLTRARATEDEFLRLVEGASAVLPLHPVRPADTTPRMHPSVRVDGQMRTLLGQLREALLGSEVDLDLFDRGGRLVKLRRDHAEVEIEPVTIPWLTYFLADRVDWIRGTHEVDARPDEQAIRALAASLPEQLPKLDAVVTAPFFDPTGELVADVGYHAPTRTYSSPSAPWRHRRLAERSSLVVRLALNRLQDLLVDFPFQSKADFAHALCLFLLPFVRRMIDGPTPLHVIEAPGPGTGKTLLANLVSIVATGHPTEAIALPSREGEISKLIGAELSRGRSLIVFDNVDHDRRRSHLESSALASVLTTQAHASRRLGTSDMMKFPNNAAWVLTGNNPALSRELARRSVRIRIDARRDEPWRRTKFRHGNILRFADENRESLTIAILRMVEAWVLEGRPRGKRTLGSMEAWAETLGGILEVVGVPDFLCSADEFVDEMDAESGEWRLLFKLWGEAWNDAVKKTSDINALCVEHGLLESARGEGSERSQATRLANELQRQRDQVHSGWRLVVVRDGRSHGRTYRLQQASPAKETA